MLITAVRNGLSSVRRAFRGAVLLALLSYLPLGLMRFEAVQYFVALVFIARTTIMLALARHLAAWRRDPLPPLPVVDEQGRRIGRPEGPPGPVQLADRAARTALRSAGALLRPAVRLTLVQLLVFVTAPLFLLILGGDRVRGLDEREAVLVVLPLVALGMAFIGLAGQRVAIEGDPRVLVATAHSVRIARQRYGSLLALSLAQPAIAAVALLTLRDDRATVASGALAIGLFLLSLALELVVTATANEIYIEGPRLDVPADFATRPPA